MMNIKEQLKEILIFSILATLFWLWMFREELIN